MTPTVVITLTKSVFIKLYCAFLLTVCFCVVQAAEKPIEKIRLIWHEKPANHAVLAWCGDEGTVSYGVKGSDEASSAKITVSIDAIGLRNNFVHLNNLKPDTEYALKIITPSETSKTYWFKTAPNKPSRFTFIAGGDSRNHHDARQRANRMVAKLRPLFVAFGGDMTNRDTDEEWVRWLDDWELTTGTDGKLTPIVAARGNHERTNESVSNLFNSPHPSIYYATAIGGADFLRLYTLNTEIDVGGEQKNWLSKDLKEQPNVLWKFAQYHKPMRSHVAAKREGIAQYRAWSALFYQYGFNLVFESDSHAVKRTWPIRPSIGEDNHEGFIRDDKNGIVFVGEGCWGAPLRSADDNKPWTKASGSFNQFKWVHVYPDKIEVRSILIDNVDEVEQISDENVFAAPKGLQLWTPESGAVERIPARPDFKPNTDELSSLDILDSYVRVVCRVPLFEKQTTAYINHGTKLPGKIYYTIDGSDPTSDSTVYRKVFTLTDSCTIKAIFIADNGDKSFMSTVTVTKISAPVGTKGPKPAVPLGSLSWTSQKSGWSKVRKNINLLGRPLKIRNKVYKKGISMHIHGSVTYACNSTWKRFVASVGYGDRIRGSHSGVFEVHADGDVIYRSPSPLSKYDIQHVNVKIPEGTKSIKLITKASKGGSRYDYINVVDAGFCKK